MANRLTGKIALVIGAGSSEAGWGNGKAAAVAFAREGAAVAAIDVRIAAAEETADIIRSEGGTSIALAADATDPEAVRRVIEAALQAYGRIDILHNNVGIGAVGGVADTDPTLWQRIFDTNVTSAFLACRGVLPIMVGQGGGAIINVSSIGSLGIAGVPLTAYGMSKAALNYLTRAIAIEYAARGIRVNVILPGLMDRPMVRGSAEMIAHFESEAEMLEARHAQSPTGRMGDAWDVAAAAVFLASNDAKYINGVILPVDGGLSCRMG